MNNKVIKCANEVIESLNEYNPNELKILYGVLYKLSSMISVKTRQQNMEIDDMRMEITEEDDDGKICLITTITLEQLKELTQKSNLSQKEIENIIRNLLHKAVKIREREGNTYQIINIFTSCKVYIVEQKYEIHLNSKFTPYLIDLTNSFTLWELNEAVSLSTKYGHALYLLGMQYHSIHKFSMDIAKLYEHFNIPAGYRLYDIEKAFTAAIKEIEAQTNLRINFKKDKRANKPLGLTFNFKYIGQLYTNRPQQMITDTDIIF